MTDILLKAENLSKKFYRPSISEILTSVSLEVKKGEVVAIMGASGQGKSTLLHILGTLEPATGGHLEIAGEKVKKSNSPSIRNKHIGFVFQSFHLLEDYTTLENILMPARIARRGITKDSDALNRAYALLETVGLSNRAHYKASLLSGGEKQRIAIARALCNDPSLILADEPSGNLDQNTSKYIHDLLLCLAKDQNKGLIIVTHNPELARACDRTLILQSGKLHAAD